MKIELSFADLAGIETELLAVVAVDTQTAKDPDARPLPVLLTSDEAVKAAAAAVLATGEFKAGVNETRLPVWRPNACFWWGWASRPRRPSTVCARPRERRCASPSRVGFVSWHLRCLKRSLFRPVRARVPRSRGPSWATSTPIPIAAIART